MQLDNINEVEKLTAILKELENYSIDISEYFHRLIDIINQYRNYELEFSIELTNLEYDMRDCILFLDLIHSTKTWDFEVNLDEVFISIEYEITRNFLDVFNDSKIKQLIIEKYYDLSLKKILKDYIEGKNTYLEKYMIIKNYPYLKKSIIKFLTAKDIDDIEVDEYDYDLEGLLNKIFQVLNNNKKVVIPDFNEFIYNEVNTLINNLNNHFQIQYRDDTAKIIKQLKAMGKCNFSNFDFAGWDLKYVDFTNQLIINSIFKGTNARIDPQRVKFKSIRNCDLEGLDLSRVDFYDIEITHANLKGSNANINPQQIRNLDMWYCNLEGLDFSNARFDNIGICGANLKGTKAIIDPQRVNAKRIDYCNLEGLDLSEANFDDVLMTGANLRGTNAKINPQTVRYLDLSDTCLEGCYVINNFNGYSDKTKPNLEGVILVDSHDEIKELEDNHYNLKNIRQKNYKVLYK